MKNAFQRHLAAIHAGAVTKTNVIGVRKALNNMARIDAGYSPNRIATTADEADALLEAIYKRRPRVTGELHDSGLAVLRSKRHARKLAQVADVIAELDHFELRDFDEIGRGHFVPVYRAVARNGDGFDFRNVPWQSGGNGPEIL